MDESSPTTGEEVLVCSTGDSTGGVDKNSPSRFQNALAKSTAHCPGRKVGHDRGNDTVYYERRYFDLNFSFCGHTCQLVYQYAHYAGIDNDS